MIDVFGFVVSCVSPPFPFLSYLSTLSLYLGQSLLSSLAEKYPVKEPCIDSNKVHWTPLVDSAHIRDKFFIRNKVRNDIPGKK